MNERYLDERSRRRLALAESTSPPFGVGAFVEGNVLLIGEQASNPAEAPEQQPFCDNRGCSGWLNRQLDAENIPEDKLFWLNALYNTGERIDLRPIMCDLKPRLVVALGNVAHQLCEFESIPHATVYHPQYWKRFRSKERYPLLELLHTTIQEMTRPMKSFTPSSLTETSFS